MRFGFVILVAALFSGCTAENIAEGTVIELDTASVLCQLDLGIVAVETGTPQQRAKEILQAREQCKAVLSDDKNFKQIALKYLLGKFDDPKNVRLKDILIRENSKAPYQKELAGKIAIKNNYGDFSNYRYFNVYVDNASFKWVTNFEEIRN